jgi:hypothetical protein
MTRGEKIAFTVYGAALIVLFSSLGLFLTPSDSRFPTWLGWLEMPGALIALFTVGAHSDFIMPAIQIANIAFYFLVPFLIFRLARRISKAIRTHHDDAAA